MKTTHKKVEEDHHAPPREDDPEYPELNEEDDEYETDESSDLGDVMVDGVYVTKKKKKKGFEIKKTKGGEFVRQRKEMKANTTKRILGEIMPYFEEYSALDATPPPKPQGKCAKCCSKLCKFLGCMKLNLHEAVMSGSEKHIDVTIEAIHQGKKSNRAKLNIYDQQGQTPLSMAVKSKQNPMAFALLGRKIDPDVPDLDTGRTPLFYACMHGDLQLNKLLLLSGADPNYGDFNCVTPLMMAVMRDDADSVHFICTAKLKFQLDMDMQDLNGWTALHYGAYRNCAQSIIILLDNGADRDVRDMNNRKALHIARHFDQYDAIAKLEDVKSKIAFAEGEDD